MSKLEIKTKKELKIFGAGMVFSFLAFLIYLLPAIFFLDWLRDYFATDKQVFVVATLLFCVLFIVTVLCTIMSYVKVFCRVFDIEIEEEKK